MTPASQLRTLIAWACLLEVRAPKPGNVHPEARFDDLDWGDFVRSAHAIAPVLATAAERGVGAAVRDAVATTRQVAPSNTNLGIVLLLAPLAAAAARGPLREQLEPVLAGLSQHDARLVYEAIRLAQPGGLGTAPEGDVAAIPPGTLREMMRLAAHRDSIAAEYAQSFPLTLDHGLPLLEARWPGGLADPCEAIVGLQLELLARVPDTLIARKCGPAVSQEATKRAREVLARGWPVTPEGQVECEQFDAWLRADGHRRNPGTTADLVASSLFAFLLSHPDRIEALPPGWFEELAPTSPIAARGRSEFSPVPPDCREPSSN
ncbi:MAG: triphosphoribosyl-dephospho-CoA synthase [Planctomycetaceae bacterium]|jgi:triphosphoribosyl-dephospho-CoA synthase